MLDNNYGSKHRKHIEPYSSYLQVSFHVFLRVHTANIVISAAESATNERYQTYGRECLILVPFYPLKNGFSRKAQEKNKPEQARF